MFNDICSAFKNSGSVYEFNNKEQVILIIDKKTSQKINIVKTLLESNIDAYDKFTKLVNGLIYRSIDPADAIGDAYIVFEDYIKKFLVGILFKKQFYI